MPMLFAYSKRSLLASLEHSVPQRWPGEHVLFVTEARRERFSPPNALAALAGDSAPDRSEEGYLAVTERRLLYRDRLSHASLVRGIGMLFFGIALGTLVAGGSVLSYLALGGMGAALWTG